MNFEVMSSASLTILSLIWHVSAWSHTDYEDGTDLAAYVSRPDLRSPLFNISRNDLARVTPGYWFVAPYRELAGRLTEEFRPHQIGPHIYDQTGGLIWSGASYDDQRDAFDFKVSGDEGQQQLSFILNRNSLEDSGPLTNGLVMNSDYTTSKLLTEIEDEKFDLHELSLIDKNRRAIFIATNTEYEEPVLNQDGSYSEYRVTDYIFKERDLITGSLVFEWSAMDHIQLNESTIAKPNDTVRLPPWDFFHMNSVEKTSNGDYIISARHTNAIYRISGVDGRIIWRLGGTNSSFRQDFNFSSQHDARVYVSNDSAVLLSFLNNASNNLTDTADYSTVMLVELNTRSMTATMIKQWARPDRKLSKKRGNAQFLANGHVFICWSDNAYITEHGPNGEVVLEASFLSDRFVTYRGFKFNFTGHPIERPRAVAQVYGTSAQTLTTVVYVSWNGDTSTDTWRFYGYGSAALAGSGSGGGRYIGSTPRAGFETAFQFAGYYPWIVVEAVDRWNESLRKSLGAAVVQMARTVGLPGDQRDDPPDRLGWEAEEVVAMYSMLSAFNVAMLLLSIVTGCLFFIQWRRRRSRKRDAVARLLS